MTKLSVTGSTNGASSLKSGSILFKEIHPKQGAKEPAAGERGSGFCL